jgi:hypothetical protein
MTRRTLLTSVGLLALGFYASAQTTYTGNGNTGFGGPVGLGSLTLSDNGTTITGTFTPGTSGFGGNGLVLYIDSGPGGFASTAGFTDTSDGNRSEISGLNGGNPADQSVLTFQSGFAPNYAIALSPGGAENFGGIWTLVNGGTFPFDGSANLTPTSSGASSYTFSIPVTDIGLTPDSGQSFTLFGTYISDTGFRSTEAIAGNDTGTQGWNPFTQTGDATYTIESVPEPSAAALAGLSGLAALFAWKRKQ